MITIGIGMEGDHMYAPTIEKPLTFEEFLAWDDGSGRDFELSDGFSMPIVDPNAKYEDVSRRSWRVTF